MGNSGDTLPQLAINLRRVPLWYFKNVLLQNGLYSSIPNIASLVGTFRAAVLADFLIKKRIKVIRVRKLMQCIGRSEN